MMNWKIKTTHFSAENTTSKIIYKYSACIHFVLAFLLVFQRSKCNNTFIRFSYSIDMDLKDVLQINFQLHFLNLNNNHQRLNPIRKVNENYDIIIATFLTLVIGIHLFLHSYLQLTNTM